MNQCPTGDTTGKGHHGYHNCGRTRGQGEGSGIESDPNNPDDEEYIVRLVGQVVRVSVETVRIVNALPAEYATDQT